MVAARATTLKKKKHSKFAWRKNQLKINLLAFFWSFLPDHMMDKMKLRVRFRPSLILELFLECAKFEDD